MARGRAWVLLHPGRMRRKRRSHASHHLSELSIIHRVDIDLGPSALSHAKPGADWDGAGGHREAGETDCSRTAGRCVFVRVCVLCGKRGGRFASALRKGRVVSWQEARERLRRWRGLAGAFRGKRRRRGATSSRAMRRLGAATRRDSANGKSPKGRATLSTNSASDARYDPRDRAARNRDKKLGESKVAGCGNDVSWSEVDGLCVEFEFANGGLVLED